MGVSWMSATRTVSLDQYRKKSSSCGGTPRMYAIIRIGSGTASRCTISELRLASSSETSSCAS